MAELEEANKKVKQAQQAQVSRAPSPSSTTDFSFISMSDSRLMSPEIESNDGSSDTTRTRADVQDWIAKARESIQAFDGYINMGGPGVRTSDLLAEDADGSDAENDDLGVPDEDDDNYALTVEEDAEDLGEPSGDEESMHTRRLSSTTNEELRPKKGRLATIPSPAAPFGLMAKLHLGSTTRGLRRVKSKSSIGADDEEEEGVGLANPDFFRPSE
jgi:hypothetical protein